MRWGEAIEAAAARELEKQTGLTASFAVQSFYRKQDIAQPDGTVLEDKLFAILSAHELRGELTGAWHAGTSRWMTLAELQSQERFFTDTPDIIAMSHMAGSYRAAASHYELQDY